MDGERMIFVTVGTHEQSFDRLVEYIDNLKKDNKIEDEVIIQTGFCTYKPVYCKWSKLIPYGEMEKHVANARIVITHGGPASFIMPLKIGKIPIVVPRQVKFNEHVNNHQLDFVKSVNQKMGIIIPIENIDDLYMTIENYDTIVASMNSSINSNNIKFNHGINEIVKSLFLGETK